MKFSVKEIFGNASFLLVAFFLSVITGKAQTSPSITVQPTNQVAFVKTNSPNKTFVVSATGSTPLFYQWQFNSNNVTGATNSSLILTNVQLSNGGNYDVVVSNANGTATSSNAFLTVIDLAIALDATNLIWTTSNNAPWFPEGSTTHDGIAAAQENASNNGQVSVLQTSVAGPGIISFWWRVNNQSSPYLTSLAFLINGVTQTNITTPNGWQQVIYYCGTNSQLLKWAYTNINSAGLGNGGWVDQVSFISGPTPASISVAPSDRTLTAGNNTAFSVTAFGTPPLFYQWQFNGTNISGAKSATYSVSDVQAIDQGSYSIIVSNAFGVATTNAALTVNPSIPTITSQPASSTNVIRGSAVFTSSAKGSEPLAYQWLFNGTNIIGATNTTLFLTSLQTNNIGSYQFAASNTYGTSTSSIASLTLVSSMIVAWGNNVNGLFNIATGVTNAIGVSAGYYTDLALKSDGSIIGAGENLFGEAVAPSGLNNVVAVSAGNDFSLALKASGTIVAWGQDPTYYPVTRVPPNLTNAITISAGYDNSLALRKDGTVAAWGWSDNGETNVPTGLSNVVAISEGEVFSVALKNDGTVIAWGDNSNGETNVPAGLSNVVAIAAGVYSTFVLKNDGTVTNFGLQSFITIPTGLTNVAAIAAGDGFNGWALKRDGTVIGLSVFSSTPPMWLTNVVAISAGEFCNLAILNDGSPYIEQQPINQTAYSSAATGFNVVSVGIQPLFYQWQFNGTNIDSGTNSTLLLTNVPLSSVGSYLCIVSNQYGVAVSSPATLTVLRSTPRFDTSSSNLQFTSGGLSLQLNELSGHGAVIIYASTNLINWQPIFTNSPIVGTLQFLDSSSTNIPAQFYRAVEQ
jgi:hypothetical protein